MKKKNCGVEIVYGFFLQAVYHFRFWLMERDRRKERTAEVFVSVVSISHPVASHKTHTEPFYAMNTHTHCVCVCVLLKRGTRREVYSGSMTYAAVLNKHLK